MQFFGDFFLFLSTFLVADEISSVLIDGEVIALAGISLTMLTVFGFVVRNNVEKREEANGQSKARSPLEEDPGKELDGIPSLETDRSTPGISTASENNEREMFREEDRLPEILQEDIDSTPVCFHFPVKGQVYEVLQDFLRALPEGDHWEVHLYAPNRKLSPAATKEGSMIVFQSGFPEEVAENRNAVLWKLEWEGLRIGQVLYVSRSEINLNVSTITPLLESITERLALAAKTEDYETGWFSHLSFCNTLEKERVVGDEPKILLFIEFRGAEGRLLPALKSFGNWWKEKYGESASLFRIRNHRVAAFLTSKDWMAFQEALPLVMEFLGSSDLSLNVGASVRIRLGDKDWEYKARKALYSSVTEGLNRLVCL
ncbi:hypothetical protein LEP1GSC047_4098 [Leptospira inadai serovar Lyme str. 10]|uniref:GGDEF domain-containing protein n=2 Tax=Leptospira inadai serovar Lyme TaxID=293084 RepID=V6HLD2_9LEPT|nr:hypothetical protein [Leptospira inadai]EQA37705.1 hypothetical protein LEP1GSC047_4098 [Leptospira inadai serovar Lyme str. 10]PNV73045.1 hypothetical protein BES34_018340 [Leptospira inadai serovar Lyme]